MAIWNEVNKRAIATFGLSWVAIGALNAAGLTNIRWPESALAIPGSYAMAVVGVASRKRLEGMTAGKRILAGLHEELDELNVIDAEEYEAARAAILLRMGRFYDDESEKIRWPWHRATDLRRKECHVKECGIYRKVNIEATHLELCCAITESARIKTTHGEGVIYALPYTRIDLAERFEGSIKIQRVSFDEFAKMDIETDWEDELQGLERERIRKMHQREQWRRKAKRRKLEQLKEEIREIEESLDP